jgi:hypothetical protein
VYLAVNTFVDNALIIISDACAMPPPTFSSSSSIGGSSTRPPGSAAAAAGGGGQGLGGLANQQGLDARLRSVWLRQSVAEYVLDGFLPQLWVDLRGRWVFGGGELMLGGVGRGWGMFSTLCRGGGALLNGSFQPQSWLPVTAVGGPEDQVGLFFGFVGLRRVRGCVC